MMDKTQIPVIEGFQILKKLGEGGMAQVWQARQLSLDRIVALKILPQRARDDPAEAEQFRREAQAAARLKHPGIVQVHDAGVCEGIRYIVMEYVNGYSVGALLRRKTRLSEEDALTIVEHVAVALKYAWEKSGIVHCDIKPDNILVDEDGTVKVADLGLARMLGFSAKATDKIEGTPSYMAPEQAKGESDLDCRTDIYGLGATLYDLVTGATLFAGLDADQVLESKTSGQTGISAAALAKVSPSLAALITKMTAPRREDRPPDWASVLAETDQAHVVSQQVDKPAEHAEPGKSTRRQVKIRKSAPQKGAGGSRQTGWADPEKTHGRFGAVFFVVVLVAGLIAAWLWLGRDAQRRAPRVHEDLGVVEQEASQENESAKPEVPLRLVQTKEEETIERGVKVMAPAETNRAGALEEGRPRVVSSPPDVLKSGQMGGRILWQAGKLNGRPEDTFDGWIEDEYKQLVAEEGVLHIRKPEDFVQTIRPRQTFVIHVGALAAQGCFLRLAITSPLLASREKVPYLRCDATNRTLRITWNDQVLWRRWIAPGHVVVEVFVPVAAISKDDNLLVVENEGEKGLCFDAVWLETYCPGPRMFAALEDAEWVGKAVAQQAPVCALNLPAPTEGQIAVTNDLSFERQRNPPREAREAIGAWPTLKETDVFLGSATNTLQQTATRWQMALENALRRGMLPVVATAAAGSKQVWRLWAQRFGPFVGYWILHGESSAVTTAADAIRERVPDAHIVWKTSPELLLGKAERSGWEAGMIGRRSGYYGARTDLAPGALRATAWRKGLSAFPEPFDQWLSMRPAVCVLDIIWQRKQAWGQAEAMAQWWMAGGNKMIVEGGGRGDFLFPDETGAPTVAWDAIRLLLPLGEGTATRSVGNVIPTEGGQALADTYWAVANNATNLATMVVYAEHDGGRSVEVSMPVPWNGATTVAIESLQLHARAADPESLPGAKLKVNTRGAWKQPMAGGTQEWGTATFPLTLASVHLLRLTPAGMVIPARPIALPSRPEAIRLPLVKGMFQLSSKPLPEDRRLAAVRAVDWPVDRIWHTYQRQVAPATPGTIPAWNLKGGAGVGETVPVRNVTPWAKQSDVVILPAISGNEGRPQGVRLYWDTVRMAEAKTVAVWMLVSPADKSETRGSGATAMRPLGKQKCSLLIGTEEKLERLVLDADTWQLITASVETLRLSRGYVPQYLTLRSDPEAKKAIRCELNTILGLYNGVGPDKPLSTVKGFVQLDQSKSQLIIALVGTADKPGRWHARFPEPMRIMGLTIESGASESDIAAGKTTTEDAKGDGETDKATTDTKAKPAVDNNVAFEYHVESQILEVSVQSFPAAADQIPKAVLSHFFPGLVLRRGDAESVLVLRLALQK